MTLSGPTRLLAAAGAVVALTITAPAEAGGAHARRTGKPAVGQCRNLTLAQASAASNNTRPDRGARSAHNDRVIAVRNLPKGVTYAELNTAAKVEQDGRPALLPGLPRRRWVRTTRSATVRRTPTSTSCRRPSSAATAPAGCGAT